MENPDALDLRWNHRLQRALLGRRLPASLPLPPKGQPVFSFWGEDIGFSEDDIHATRAYRIFLNWDDERRITDVFLLIEGELLSPCCGYSMEGLDEFDYDVVLQWCLEQTED